MSDCGPGRHILKVVMVTMTSTKQELMLQLVNIAKQMIPLEEKIKMEQEARKAEHTREQDSTTGRFVPATEVSAEPGELSREVAKKIAEKAGVSKRTVYPSVATPGRNWD